MSLRGRLAAAFFFLAVVPLAGLTVYSYFASERAFRRAVESEAGALADDMQAQVDRVAEELGRHIERLRDAPASQAMAERGAADPDTTAALLERLEKDIGDAAGLVESWEFVPMAPPPPGGPPPGTAAMPVPPPPPPPAGHGPDVERAREAAAQARSLGDRLREKLRGLEGDRQDRRRLAEAIRREVQRAAEEARPDAEEARPDARGSAPGAAPPVPGPPPPEPPRGPAGPGAPEDPALREAARAVEEATRAAAEQMGPTAAEIARSTLAQIGRAAAARIESARRERDAGRRKAELVFGRDFGFTVRRDGEAVGRVRARVRSETILESVLARSRHHPDAIPFAIDAEGRLHAPEEHRGALQKLALQPAGDEEMQRTLEDWVVATRRDPDSGLTLGIARPIREPLREIRRTAVRNLLLGLVIVAVAVVGILPLSRGITRDLSELTEGAERLGRGDLEVRVPVRSKDEVGRLAATFNRMAQELRENQDRLLEQERIRKELEMGRRIQEEMLPRDPLGAPFAEVKGVSIPAREVGGDFFNYFLLPGGEAALLVGDVSGKGVAAALVMANLQATLRARLAVEKDLATLAGAIDEQVYSHELLRTYLTLFMCVLDGPQHSMRYVSAGHNPPFLVRADGSTLALEPTGRPLGLLPGGGYEERRVDLHEGDCLFLYTDGVVESENAEGEAFGMQRLEQIIARERASGLEGLLARVEEAVRTFRGEVEAADDATMVVLRFGHP